jgi:hypothetical protein
LASQSNDESKAFLTIQAALDAVAVDRAERAVDISLVQEHVTIVLREGVHRPSSTLEINADHSFMTIMNYPGEDSVVSGAKALKTVWKPYKVNPANSSKLTLMPNHSNVDSLHPDNKTLRIVGEFDTYQGCEKACESDTTCRAFTWHDGSVGKQFRYQCWVHYTNSYHTQAKLHHVAGEKATPTNIYVADLKGQMVTDFTGLRVGGQRGQRASYPNRNPERSIYPDGWVHGATTWKKPVPPKSNVTFVTLAEPNLTDKTMFQNYMVGVNGNCEIYDPPLSYWCSEHPSGGGAFAFRAPSGMAYDGLNLSSAYTVSGLQVKQNMLDIALCLYKY